MLALPKMPKHILNLAPLFNDIILTPGLSIRPLDMYSPDLILKAFDETNGLKASNEEFHYYENSSWHRERKSKNQKNRGENLITDLKSRRSDALFLGFYSEKDKKLVGVLAIHYDKRKWLQVSPFIFPNHQRAHYAKEVYEAIGDHLGASFSDALMYAVIDKDNEGSAALFKSLGFSETIPTPENVHVPHRRPSIMSTGQRKAYVRRF